jgi:hypothetical protein
LGINLQLALGARWYRLRRFWLVHAGAGLYTRRMFIEVIQLATTISLHRVLRCNDCQVRADARSEIDHDLELGVAGGVFEVGAR